MLHFPNRDVYRCGHGMEEVAIGIIRVVMVVVVVVVAVPDEEIRKQHVYLHKPYASKL